jgi:hypothetical protein
MMRQEFYFSIGDDYYEDLFFNGVSTIEGSRNKNLLPWHTKRKLLALRLRDQNYTRAELFHLFFGVYFSK